MNHTDNSNTSKVKVYEQVSMGLTKKLVEQRS